jgi:uncharacterized protein (DUF427 family)
MSLTSPFGRAPFGARGGDFDVVIPDRVRYWEPWPRRMRAVLDGDTVVDSRDGVMLWQTGAFPVHYFPSADVREELIPPQALSLSPDRDDGRRLLPGYVSVAFDAMDHWLEEDEPVYGHPRDLYHRVDVRASSRHVVVRHDSMSASTRPGSTSTSTASGSRSDQGCGRGLSAAIGCADALPTRPRPSARRRG